MHKRIKTKKVKTSEKYDKKELKSDDNNNNNNDDDNNDKNNDYNDSNRKGKALKLATKETLKTKKTSCLIFETLLPLSPCSFVFKNQLSLKSFVAIISFSLIIVIIVIITITIVFLILILFDFIFKLFLS